MLPDSAKNLRQAASTDSRVLVETGLSGISSLCVFWRIRIASVELIGRWSSGGADCYSFYNGYLMQSFNGHTGVGAWGISLQGSAQITAINPLTVTG
jgi:hypothetical protein